MITITPLSLYIINRVRLRRLTLGISAQKLSLILGHSLNYVISIESMTRDTSYPPHEWPKLAAALGCEINDLLPAEQSTSTGELIEKKVMSLSDEADVKKIIAALKGHGLFDDGDSANNSEIPRLHGISLEMTLMKVAKHLNIQDEKQIAVLRKVLEE